MNNLKIIIPTCDSYIHMVEGLLYTISKYWTTTNKIIILGYSPPKFKLRKNENFIQLKKSQESVDDWSTDLLSFFIEFKDEFFINFVDDYLIVKNVDNIQIDSLLKLIQRDLTIGKIFIAGPHSERKDWSFPIGENLIEILQTSPYRTSVIPAIHRTSYFLSHLHKNLSPWKYELQHPKNDDVKIISTLKNHPIHWSHVYRHGNLKLIENWFMSIYEKNELSEEDKKIILKIYEKNLKTLN